MSKALLPGSVAVMTPFGCFIKMQKTIVVKISSHRSAKISKEFITKRRSLEQMLEGQKFVRGGKFTTRAEILINFETNRSYNFQISSSTASKRYKA